MLPCDPTPDITMLGGWWECPGETGLPYKFSSYIRAALWVKPVEARPFIRSCVACSVCEVVNPRLLPTALSLVLHPVSSCILTV